MTRAEQSKKEHCMARAEQSKKEHCMARTEQSEKGQLKMTRTEESVRVLELELRAAKVLHRRAGYNWHTGSHNEEACYRLMCKKNVLLGVYERLVKALRKQISETKKGN